MNNIQNKKLFSIIIPVYNEEKNIHNTYNALISIIEKIKDKYNYELIFTDNHSQDNTFKILSEISKNNKNVKILRFSKNFGYQKSILTGYIHCEGEFAIQYDCDMQDPIVLILDFIKFWEKGYKVVYGVRKSRKENFFINFLRKIFYTIINFLSEDDLPRNAGDFRLIDKTIIAELKNMKDSTPYIRGAVASMGFQQIGIEYDRNKRLQGKSKFKFRNLLGLALDGILNHSIIPLRISSIVGLFVSLITFSLAIFYFIGKIIYGPTWYAGFATTTILILLSLSLNALFFGILGEYIGRIYKEVKKSPITIIEKKINFH